MTLLTHTTNMTSLSNILATCPEPSYQYSPITGLVKYVFVDFTKDSLYNDNDKVLKDYPYIVEFIQRQFQRICIQFGIKYKTFDDIRKIASDYIAFCREVGYVEDEPIKHTEQEILDITTQTAGYDEKIEKWLHRLLTFLSVKKEKKQFIDNNENYHDEIMFNVAVYVMATRDVVLYLCRNYVLIDKIRSSLDYVHKFMKDELDDDELTELTALRKETMDLLNKIEFVVDDVDLLKTFIPSDKHRFFMKYPDNVFSKHMNELKKNHQYDPKKYGTTYFVGKPDGAMFNMFNMPLVSTINKTSDAELREEILEDYAWSQWLVKFEDELAKHPEELVEYVDLVKPSDYIHINPVFRYK